MLNLVVESLDKSAAQLVRVLAIVGDAVHNIATAEALRVFERTHMHAGPGL